MPPFTPATKHLAKAKCQANFFRVGLTLSVLLTTLAFSMPASPTVGLAQQVGETQSTPDDTPSTKPENPDNLGQNASPDTSARKAPNRSKKPRIIIPTHFQRIWYARWKGRESLLFLPPPLQVAPVLADINGDKALDLLLGARNGQLSVLLQEKGQGNIPFWRVNTLDLEVWPQGVPKESHAAWYQAQRLTPTMADLDRDGDLDLAVGGDAGMLWIFENVGDHVQPLFIPKTTYALAPSIPGKLAPMLADANGDGAPDLLIGDGKGRVWLALHQRDPGQGNFCLQLPPPDALPSEPPPCPQAPQQIYADSNLAPISPLLMDWDGDGLADVFLGRWNGSVALLHNRGTTYKPRWVLHSDHFQGIDAGGHAAPTGGDINNDGIPDLILGATEGKVRAYVRNKNNPFDVLLWHEDLLEVVSLGRRGDALRTAAGDVDGDGDLDMLVGKDFGEMFWLENRGSKTQINWWPTNTWLTSQVHRPWAAPALADMDKDGDIDGLVGGEKGGLWLLRNHGKNQPLIPEGIDIKGLPLGMRFHPGILDIDEDGDMDVVLSFENGLVMLARNVGLPTLPRYMLQTNPIARLTPARWSPAVADLTGNGQADILLGAPNQPLQLWSRDPNRKGQWYLANKAWGPQDAKGGAPVLADLTGNGILDLMLADDEGALSFWRGSAPSAQRVAAKNPNAALDSNPTTKPSTP